MMNKSISEEAIKETIENLYKAGVELEVIKRKVANVGDLLVKRRGLLKDITVPEVEKSLANVYDAMKLSTEALTKMLSSEQQALESAISDNQFKGLLKLLSLLMGDKKDLCEGCPAKDKCTSKGKECNHA